MVPKAHAVPRVTTVTAPTAVFRIHPATPGLAPAAPRGGAAVREKYDYLYSEGELRSSCRDRRRRAEAEEVFISFNNNNRDYPVRTLSC